jgi:phosphoglycolate phosphatase
MSRVPDSQDTSAPHAGPWHLPAVFFDLDGTLVDPAGGITGGIAQALRQHDLPVPHEQVLRQLVGPPLMLGLSDVVGVPPERMADVIASYRSWYSNHGFAASRVYPGVESALGALHDAGLSLAVTTSKPQGTARELLDHHGPSTYFDAVVGSSDDEIGDARTTGSKEPQVRTAARLLGVEPPAVAVVGDRHYDIDAATAVGAVGIGVAWGFADPGELEAAGAAAVITQASDLSHLLRPVVAEYTSPSVSKETV